MPLNVRRNGNAWRLDNVHDLDADAWTILDGVGGDVPADVADDDGRHDGPLLGSHAAALSERCGQERRDAPRAADHTRGRGLLLRLDRVRCGRFRYRYRAGGGRGGAAGGGGG